MVEQQDIMDVQVDITPDDIKAVMQASPLMSLQVQNRALTRKIRELQAELKTAKEDSYAKSGG